MLLTQQSILAARQSFADNARACIAAARSRDVPTLREGEFYVNDLLKYVASCERDAASALAGEQDHTFTFRQRAHYIQTGECVALLP